MTGPAIPLPQKAPACPLCRRSKSGPCPYHRATDAKSLWAILGKDVKQAGSKALVRYILASTARLFEVLPADLLRALAQDQTGVHKILDDVLNKEKWTREDLLMLSASAYVLAGLFDAAGESEEDLLEDDEDEEATR